MLVSSPSYIGLLLHTILRITPTVSGNIEVSALNITTSCCTCLSQMTFFLVIYILQHVIIRTLIIFANFDVQNDWSYNMTTSLLPTPNKFLPKNGKGWRIWKMLFYWCCLLITDTEGRDRARCQKSLDNPLSKTQNTSWRFFVWNESWPNT